MNAKFNECSYKIKYRVVKRANMYTINKRKNICSFFDIDIFV